MAPGKLFSLACGAAALVALFAAQGAVAAEDPKAAKQALRIHNWEDYLDPGVIAEFERRNDAKVEVVAFADEEEALEQLGGPGTPFDLVVLSGSAVRRAREASRLAQIDPTAIPNLKNVAAPFRSPFYDAQARYHVPYLWGTTAVIFNRTRVKDPGRGWELLWQPGLKGKVAMLNSPEEVVGAALKSLGYSLNSVDPQELNKARELLLSQKPLLAGYLESTEIRDRMASGKLWAAQIYSGDAMAAIEKNPDLEYFIPSQGAARWVDNLVIPANARNRPLALAFMNFILDGEHGAANANGLSSASPNQTARERTDKALLDNPGIYPPEEVSKRLEPLFERGASAERDARRAFLKGLWEQLAQKQP